MTFAPLDALYSAQRSEGRWAGDDMANAAPKRVTGVGCLTVVAVLFSSTKQEKLMVRLKSCLCANKTSALALVGPDSLSPTLPLDGRPEQWRTK